MKIFELTLKNFATVGITANLPRQPYPLNARISTGFLILNSYLICNAVFVVYEAETFTDYTQSIYIGSSTALILFALIILVFKSKKLFQLIGDCENLINTSMCKAIVAR